LQNIHIVNDKRDIAVHGNDAVDSIKYDQKVIDIAHLYFRLCSALLGD
jgi:hypothetical protein